MPSQGLGLAPRLHYLADRARRIDVGSVLARAKDASTQHGKWLPAVVVDMLWQAGFRNVGFQDYIDYDFAMLSRAERASIAIPTSVLANGLRDRSRVPQRLRLTLEVALVEELAAHGHEDARDEGRCARGNQRPRCRQRGDQLGVLLPLTQQIRIHWCLVAYSLSKAQRSADCRFQLGC